MRRPKGRLYLFLGVAVLAVLTACLIWWPYLTLLDNLLRFNRTARLIGGIAAFVLLMVLEAIISRDAPPAGLINLFGPSSEREEKETADAEEMWPMSTSEGQSSRLSPR
ncbi:MAG: hypothetical protein AB1776_08240 [Bacillota bacterium]